MIIKFYLILCRIEIIYCFCCTYCVVLFYENSNVGIGTDELDSAGGAVLVQFGILLMDQVKNETDESSCCLVRDGENETLLKVVHLQ